MTATEIELKLALDQRSLERVRRLPALRALRTGRAVSRPLWSVYFDTPDRRLAAAGITVRLRRDGGRLLQTVKTAGARASGLFARREWEAAVAGPGPDAHHMRSTDLPLLADPGIQAALIPLFSTDIRRTIHVLSGDGWQVEMALDVGELTAGERHETVCEVELELRSGTAADLFALGRRIVESVPARLLTQSKSDRGHALAEGRGPVPVKSTPVALTASMPLAEAFRAIARNCLHHLLANQAALLDNGDGEAVHQMRVALRRLRSAVKLFRPLVDGAPLNTLRAEIGWLLGVLGPARDAEVFLEEIIAPVIAGHPGHDGLEALREHWRRLWADDLAAARAAVAERRFPLLLLDLGGWVEGGAWAGTATAGQELGPFAARVLDKLATRMEKAAGRHLARLSPTALHRVRIVGKQLRYAGEFFAPLYGKTAARDTLAALGRLQDLLGEINDIAVAGPRLASCHHMGDAAWAAGVVAGWHEARRPRLLADAEEVWRDLRRRRRFWRG